MFGQLKCCDIWSKRSRVPAVRRSEWDQEAHLRHPKGSSTCVGFAFGWFTQKRICLVFLSSTSRSVIKKIPIDWAHLMGIDHDSGPKSQNLLRIHNRPLISRSMWQKLGKARSVVVILMVMILRLTTMHFELLDDLFSLQHLTLDVELQTPSPASLGSGIHR